MWLSEEKDVLLLSKYVEFCIIEEQFSPPWNIFPPDDDEFEKLPLVDTIFVVAEEVTPFEKVFWIFVIGSGGGVKVTEADPELKLLVFIPLVKLDPAGLFILATEAPSFQSFQSSSNLICELNWSYAEAMDKHGLAQAEFDELMSLFLEF